MLMLYCDEWKQIPLDEEDDFSKFTKWLGDGDTKANLGLSKKGGKSVGVTPSPAGSKTVSRAASVALVDQSIDEDEETEETK